MIKKITLLALLFGAGMLYVACSTQSTQVKDKAEVITSTVKDKMDSQYFTIDSDGMLIRPTDYRQWVYVGTPATPNDLNNGLAAFPEFHNVYIDPMSYEHYKATGNFRDGTILMKELVSVGSTAASSGRGYFMGEYIGLEATIKSKKHFPNDPGNWAYYSFTSPADGILKDRTKHFAAKDCNACHDASAMDDFVFTQYYPVLRAAKGAGASVIPENTARRTIGGYGVGMDDKKEEASDMAADKSAGIPLDDAGLFKYLTAGEYKKFKHKESKMHPSLGPHQKYGLPVRVFMNDIAHKSLAAKSDDHPKGSVIVKEMYDADETLNGWAVMAKTAEKGWYWYEVTSTTDMNAIAGAGFGAVACTGCHSIGTDFVRTAFPLD